MKREPLIRRYVHSYFSGWVVATMRRGRRHVRYFSDKDGLAQALRRARQYRKELLARLPIVTKIKRTYVLNTTGVIGVALVQDRTRAGSVIWRYVAQWPTPDGACARRTFSVAKYGRAEARRLAFTARRKGLAALLGSPEP